MYSRSVLNAFLAFPQILEAKLDPSVSPVLLFPLLKVSPPAQGSLRVFAKLASRSPNFLGNEG